MDELDHRALPAQIIARDLERVLNMFDMGNGVLRALEQDDIESARAVRPMVFSEKLSGQSNEFRLLSSVDGMDRSAKIHCPSCLDLDKDENRTVLGDEVQLAQRRAEIFGDDPVTLATQKAFSRRLSFLPEESSGVKNCHAMVQPDSGEALLTASHASARAVRRQAHRSGGESGRGRAPRAAANVLPCSNPCERENCNADTTGDTPPSADHV